MRFDYVLCVHISHVRHECIFILRADVVRRRAVFSNRSVCFVCAGDSIDRLLRNSKTLFLYFRHVDFGNFKRKRNKIAIEKALQNTVPNIIVTASQHCVEWCATSGFQCLRRLPQPYATEAAFTPDTCSRHPGRATCIRIQVDTCRRDDKFVSGRGYM